MKQKDGIVAVFRYLDEFCEAVETVHGRNDCKGHEAFSHTSYHELMDVAHKHWGASQVRWFTLTGALMGVTTGFGLPLWMDYDWPIIVGGKTAGIYSIPAYFIFGFELMVLFGAIATIIGMLIMGRLPNPKGKIYDVRTTDDLFAIFVPGASPSGEQAKILKERGAIEVYATNE